MPKGWGNSGTRRDSTIGDGRPKRHFMRPVRVRPSRALVPLAVAASAAALVTIPTACAYTLPVGAAHSQPQQVIPPTSGPVTSIGPAGVFLIDGKPSFPISLNDPPPLGTTDPQGRNPVRELINDGVNIFKIEPLKPYWRPAIDTPRALAWDAAAAANGVHTMVWLKTLAAAAPHGSRDANLRSVMTTLLDAPSASGIGLWESANEPQKAGTSLRNLEHSYCVGTGRGKRSWCAGEKPLDSSHLWVTIEAPWGTARQIRPYTRATDVHGMDDFPVSAFRKFYRHETPQLQSVGERTALMRSITPNHAVMDTLQDCSHSSNWYRHHLQPTRLQERFMIYDAIINGARGLGFFGGHNWKCWNATDRVHRWNWHWYHRVLQPLIRQISAKSPLGPVLVTPQTTQRVWTRDPYAESVVRTVQHKDSYDLWYFVAERAPFGSRFKISYLPRGIRRAHVYGTPSNVRIRNRRISEWINGWGVRVFDVHVPKHGQAAQHSGTHRGRAPQKGQGLH